MEKLYETKQSMMQVLPIEECDELVALGVDMKDAHFVWINDGDCPIVEEVDGFDIDYENVIPTYTLQDLMIKIPSRGCELIGLHQSIDIYGVRKWCCHYPSEIVDSEEDWYETPLMAAYNTLIKILKGNYYG